MPSIAVGALRRRGALVALATATLTALFAQSAALPASAADPVPASGSVSAVGAGTYENGSSAIITTGTWSKTSSVQDSGGSVAFASQPSTVSLTFSGTAVSWISRKTASSGINDVYIDGVKVDSVDRYSAASTFKETVWSTTSLSGGNHTIKVAYTGKKNPSSSGANVIFDAFVVGVPSGAASASQVGAVTYENGSSEVTSTGTWSKSSSIYDSAGSVAFASQTSSVSLTFTGPAVSWISRKTTSSGINDVYIDGVNVASVDRYSAVNTFKETVWSTTSLSEGTHTIKVAYTGKKNPASTSANLIFDAFVVGIPQEPVGPTVGLGTQENGSAAIATAGTWSQMDSPSDSSGSSGYLNGAGWAKLVFQGDTVRWVSRTTPTSGIADVWLDGVKVATVDRYSADTRYQEVVFEQAGLDPSVHTLKIEWTGRKNAASTGTNLLLDAIVVPDTTELVGPTVGLGTYENGSAEIVTAGGWTRQASGSDSGGSSGYLNSAGWAKLTFEGPAVQWLSRTTASSGIADVWIDGEKIASVDRYSAQTLYKQVVFEKTDLTDSVHTLKIEWTGRKNASSTGTNLLLDAIVVPDPVEPVGPTVEVGTYGADSTALRFSGAWTEMVSTSDVTGSSGYLNSPGWVKLAFRGDAIRWISRTTSSSGIADVWLDGVKVASVDRYSSSTAYKQVVFERMDLADGEHTIKIEWTGRANPASSGTNLLLDAIVVPDTTAPPTPEDVHATSSGGEVLLAWAPVSAADLADYRVYRISDSGHYQLIGRAAKSSSVFASRGLPADTDLRFSVSAVDTSGNESVKSATLPASTGTTAAGSHRYDNCPAATTTVTTPAEFKAAVTAARPGSVIRMAPGVYLGQLEIKATGTAEAPIWICGSRDVILDGDGLTISSPINVSFSAHVIVTGMTATNALKGVTVRGSHHVTISDMLVESIGYEGIHLRSNTTDSVVVGNTIRKTGQLDPFYGEGVYIGSSKNNWCTYTNCLPDRSDRNAVIGNSISETGSDLIEAKEGTTDGLISGNVLDGSNGMARTESWVQVAGNDWVVTGNTGTNSSLHGFRVSGHMAEWGLGTTFSDNVADVNAAGLGYELYELNGPGTSNTLVSCGNTVRGAASGFANVACTT